MNSATRVDQALGAAIGLPDGVRERLLTIAGWRADSLEQLRARLAAGGAIVAVREAHERLELFYGDNRDSAFSRVLRIPPLQLAAESPVMHAIESHARALRDEAKAALKLQNEVDTVSGGLKKLGQSAGARFPTLFARLRAAAKLNDSDIGEAILPQDSATLGRRLAWLRQQTDDLTRTRSELTTSFPSIVVDPDRSQITLEELAITAELRLRARHAYRDSSNSAIRIRGVIAAHIGAMRQASGRGQAGRSAATLFALELTELAARAPRAVGHHFEDANLWIGTLAEQSAYLQESVRKPDWIAPPPQSLEPKAPSTVRWRVLPIDDGFVAISSAFDTLLSLGADVELERDKTYEAELDAPESWSSPELLAFDLRAALERHPSQAPGWYSLDRAIRIRLLALFEGIWYGRIEVKGKLRCLDADPSNASRPSAGAVRVLAHPHQVKRVQITPLKASAEHTFLGFRTDKVGTALAGYDQALCRRAEPSSTTREMMLSRELGLYQSLEKAGFRHAIHYLGQAEPSGSSALMYVYGLPLAIPPNSERVKNWLLGASLGRFACAQAVARLSSAVMRSGNSAGLYHVDALAFGAEVVKGQIRPVAVLFNAPATTRLGLAYDAMLPAREIKKLTFERIGFRGLPGPVAAGATASQWTEKIALCLFALEMLAEPVIATVQSGRWEDVPALLHARASVLFPKHSAWASAIGAALVDPLKSVLIDEFCGVLNSETSR